jgi:Ohr subfamily peroxiredoxin
MMTPLYTAQAKAEAGRDGRVWSEDGHIDLPLTPPKAMGGPETGTNPEQLFAAGYAACFHSAMKFVAGQKKIDTDGSSVEGHVSIGQNDKGPGFMLAVEHKVDLPSLSQQEAEALVAEAHQVCPYSNATRGNIDVNFTIVGGRS